MKPSVSFFSLGKAFAQLRRETPWLQELPAAPVRYVLKHQSRAFQKFFKHGGYPRFKSRHGTDSVTIPDDIRIRSSKLLIPRLGWYVLRRRGGNPYPGAKPVQVMIRKELGRWYATVCYAVPVAVVQPMDNGEVIGLDMNVRQITTSEGEIIRLPVLSKLEARRRRY